MSYQLKLDEMQEALSNCGHPQADAFERALCSIGEAMAEALSERLHIDVGIIDQQGVAFAGICAPFNPRYRGQPLPNAMLGYDDDDAWDSDDADLPAMPRELYADRLAQLRADQDGYVLGAPDGSETPNPDGWRRDNPEEAEELEALETLDAQWGESN
jgi:hypothetical protein